MISPEFQEPRSWNSKRRNNIRKPKNHTAVGNADTIFPREIKILEKTLKIISREKTLLRFSLNQWYLFFAVQNS